MPKYDTDHHHPPAPVAWIVLEHPDTGKRLVDVPMLIDSGADVSLLPTSTIDRLELTLDTTRAFELEGYDGQSKCIVHPAKAILEVEAFRFRGNWLFADRAIGVVGRDILNRVVLELHGPNSTWTMRRT